MVVELPRRSGARGLVVALSMAWSPAHAQGLATHHPVVPAGGIATENGPGTLWVNPANLAYDRDPRFGLFYSRGGVDAPTSLAATAGIGGFGLGVHNLRRSTGVGVPNDWAIDYGTSIALPKRFAVGALVSWNIIGNGPNYVGWDLGLSWRPLPWLGFGGVAANIGNPDPRGLATPRTGAGLALRPLGRFAVIGADYTRLFGVDPTDASKQDHVTATLRLRPLEGLYLRGAIDSEIDGTELGALTGTAGIELYVRGSGLGYVASTDTESTGQTLFIGTDEPGESLFRSGRQVPSLELDRSPPYQPRSILLSDTPASWLDTLELIRRMEDDPGVRGLVLTLDGASLSFARCRELRDRILALQARDKKVLVYLTGSPSNGDYYVASAASRVAMHPAADLELIGLSIELTHLRGLLDLVGVEPQYVKRADYKTAPETYTEIEPTPANLEMTEALLDDIYGELVDGIASGRTVEASIVKGWIDGGPHTAEEALAGRMVDVLLYPDELEDELEKLHGGGVSTEALLERPQPHSPWEDPQQIAIVYVEGGIVSGESSLGGFLSGRTAGSKSVIRALDRARNDPQVRAVVLRVDSPGGSSFASDEIWRATQRLQKEGKPVVVSMGGVAASGGYYVAAGADRIWAEPSTLTGSIGVFSGKFATGELQERLGVTTTVVGRGRNASMNSSTKPWDDVQRARMQEMVDATYAQFKERVASGRELDADAVEEIARGRVWSGTRARDLGLVDELGGFQDAIADARRLAGIPENREVGLVTSSGTGALLESLAPSVQSFFRPQLMSGPAAEELSRLQELVGPLDTLFVPVFHAEEQIWMLEPIQLRVGGE